MGAFPLTIEEYEPLNPVAMVNHEGQQIRFCTPSRTTACRHILGYDIRIRKATSIR